MFSRNPIYPVLVVLLLPLLQSCHFPAPQTTSKVPLKVEYFSINLDPDKPNRKIFDQLQFLAGFELRSDDSRFGGLSGLALSKDGNTLYAVSDHGYWLSTKLHHDIRDRLVHIGPWKIAPLLRPDGNIVNRRQRDAEALVKDKDGSFVVAFERIHRLWRYPPPPKTFSSPARLIPHPPGLEQAPNNGGVESIGILSDGRFFLLTEYYENDDGNLKGWLMWKNKFYQLSYLKSDGFNPTDIATLANGDILLLERRYNWMWGASLRLRRFKRENLKPGIQLKGKEVALFEPPLAIDNFEGLTVRENPKYGTLLYIISDDNYNPLQRTLLLQFRLLPGNPKLLNDKF